MGRSLIKSLNKMSANYFGSHLAFEKRVWPLKKRNIIKKLVWKNRMKNYLPQWKLSENETSTFLIMRRVSSIDLKVINYCKVNWLWDPNSNTLKSWSFWRAWYLSCFSTCFKTIKSIVLRSINWSQYDLHAKVCHSHAQHQPTLHR